MFANVPALLSIECPPASEYCAHNSCLIIRIGRLSRPTQRLVSLQNIPTIMMAVIEVSLVPRELETVAYLNISQSDAGL